jgi:hypothetical protein
MKKNKLMKITDHFTAEITKEYKNGDAKLTITYDDYFKEFIKKLYGKKKYSKKMVEKFVIDALNEGVKNERNQKDI